MLGALVQHLFHQSSQKAAGISLVSGNSITRKYYENLASHSENIIMDNAPANTVRDIRTVISTFDLDPKITTFACCPLQKCSATHPPMFVPQAGVWTYPVSCQNKKFKSVCNSPLVKGSRLINGISVPYPKRVFPYNSFHDHVAAMLSRPGIEVAIQTHMRSRTFSEEISDIMSSKAICDLLDPTGHPFVREVGTELRLVWAFAGDWYNPLHNKTSGKSVSSGVTILVCLSLPSDLRLQEVNIYFSGAIPGPQEPAVDATNHYIRPLVDDLCEAYHQGVRYSRTHDFPAGRDVRSLMAAVIADTMASKKFTGNCSHSSKYFCSRCRLPRELIHITERKDWPQPLTRDQHNARAEAWQSASSEDKRASAVSREGIRWSEFLRLPYWNPAEHTITEAMHVLLLGLVPRHCRELLGLNFKDLPRFVQEGEVSSKLVDEAQAALESAKLSKLRSFKLDVLKALCIRNGVALSPPSKGRHSKAELLSALVVSSSTFSYRFELCSQRPPLVREKHLAIESESLKISICSHYLMAETTYFLCSAPDPIRSRFISKRPTFRVRRTLSTRTHPLIP